MLPYCTVLWASFEMMAYSIRVLLRTRLAGSGSDGGFASFI